MSAENGGAGDDAELRKLVAARLRSAVEAVGTQAIVAERSGVPERTLASLLSAKGGLKLNTLMRLADATGVTVEFLLGRNQHITLAGIGEVGYVAPRGFTAVPYLEVRASAGSGRVSIQAETVASEFMLFSDAWLRSLGVTPQNAELLQAEGDSMWPTIHDRDLMLVDRGYGQVVHGKIYALVVNGLVVVKRVNFLAAGGLVLLSDNDRYPSETIVRDEVSSLSFQGRIAWYGRAI